ncbi:zinc/iron regulated transporter-related protein 88E isoform X2 [Arctopsyche grandis]|uniref:zinc/iron regulated transporter-related protein 88E isoform X2 n=1 Tax=Arctopsyche grandis TaxID=121162 RepID=UPI00406D9A9B
MDLNASKIAAMASLGVGSMFVGLLPAWLSRTSRWSPRDSIFRSVLLCFGGGVLFATAILHMLAESRETIGIHADVAFCCGFFFIYFVDELVHAFYGRPVDELGRGYDTATIEDNHHGNSHSYGATEASTLLATEPTLTRCHIVNSEPCTSSSAGKSGLLFALTIHAVLEGLAVGLQESSVKVYLLLGAIASHKLVVGFCLGAELISIHIEKLWVHILAIFTFSFGSALGIGFGMIIEDTDEYWTKSALGVMQSLAGGTLLYVTLIEVLPRERARWHRGPRIAGSLQFGATTIGFLIMYILTKYLDEGYLNTILN